MNARIKQLAEQAGQGEPFHIPPEFVEKFARLIVKECIDYCGENLSKTVGGALKIHFGVEE
jgi:chorismate mutase